MVDHRRMEEIQKFQMKDISNTCGKYVRTYVVNRGREFEQDSIPWDFIG